jgi:serine phosphatase RsbU (regulator of sigma subunit)
MTEDLYQKVQERVERLSLLQEISQAFHASLELEELLPSIFSKVIEVIGAEGGAIWLFNETRGELVCQVAKGETADRLVGIRLKPGVGVVGWVHANVKPTLISDVHKDERWTSHFDEEVDFVTRSLIATPLEIRGESLGVISLVNKIGQHSFTNDDLELLVGMAQNAAGAIKNAQLYEEVQEATEKQITLRKIDEVFHSTIELNELLPTIFSQVVETMGAEGGSIWLLDKRGETLVCEVAEGAGGDKMVGSKLKPGEGIAGWVAANKKPDMIVDVHTDERWASRFDQKAKVETRTLISAPLVVKGESLGAINVINKVNKECFTEQDRDFLVSLASKAALAIKNAQLVEQIKEDERLKRDMEIASRIQMSLLPRYPPQIAGTELVGRCVPAKDVGGDYYDFFTTVNDELGILIADVSGHSVGSALLMTVTRSALRFESLRQESAAAVLAETNRAMYHDLSNAELFITVFYACFNTETKVLTWANGGHNLPFVWRPGTEECILLDADGMLIGVLDSVEYEERQMTLLPGDVVLLYTDGVTEAKNPAGEMFGERRLENLIKQNCQRPAREILDAVYNAVYEHSMGVTQYDDITAIVMRVTD